MGTIQITKAKDSKEKKDKKIKTIAILLLIFFVILLLLSGYTFAKSIEATTINANATVAEPILVIENNPQVDITASQNTGTYIFKVKNYNNQKIYNMNPTDVHYNIADWALSGNRLNEVDTCLWYLNPFRPTCRSTFPSNGAGTLHTRLGEHCFYRPTPLYDQT